MKNDINLSSGVPNSKKVGGKLIGVSLAFFILCFVISAILVIYSLAESAKVASLSESEKNLNSQIGALANQKARLLSINERLSSIDKIIATRREIAERADAVLNIIPQDFSVSKFSSNSNTVQISLVSSALSDFDSLFEARIPQFAKDNPLGLTRIDMKSFSEREDGYEATFIFEFIGDENV